MTRAKALLLSKGKAMNKQGIIIKLKAEREKVWWEWDALNVPTYSDDYEEDYEDTVTRLTLDGTITGLDIAIAMLEGR